MSFPEREWEDIKKTLNKKGTLGTTRCCRELDKYKVGSIYETPWGDLIKVTKITKYSSVEDIPSWKNFDKGMKISARKREKYGNRQWEHIIFNKIKK